MAGTGGARPALVPSELLADSRLGHVQIFENRGEMMGASNPHPHGQIWATEHVPMHVEGELRHFTASVAVVPYRAVWPFETVVATRRVVPSLLEQSDDERASLARVLRRLVQLYDRLFDTRFQCSMGLHQTSHLHVHFYAAERLRNV